MTGDRTSPSRFESHDFDITRRFFAQVDMLLIGCRLQQVDPMAITEQDLQLYARRIRTHFPPSLQDVAEELAFSIAQSAGLKAKLLRPETTLGEIIGWMESLDAVEARMALMVWEEEFQADLPALLDRRQFVTFQDLVQRIAASRRSLR